MTTGEALIDATKSYVPIMVVGAILAVVFQFGTVYRDLTAAPSAVNQQLADFKFTYNADLSTLRTSINDIAKAVSDLRTSFLDPTRGVPTDVIRYSELYVFCLELERGNTGIKCPLGGAVRQQ
jgi:hypothetical protein